MGKNKNKKKLALKKETVRKLDTLSEAQLRNAAGGALAALTGDCYKLNTTIANTAMPTYACIRTTTLTFGCDPSYGC